eukprot:366522-Chlamydomonas_euryale.AAC.9
MPHLVSPHGPSSESCTDRRGVWDTAAAHGKLRSSSAALPAGPCPISDSATSNACRLIDGQLSYRAQVSRWGRPVLSRAAARQSAALLGVLKSSLVDQRGLED